MQKPKQYGQVYASIFQDTSVVAVYHHRPPYPPDTFRFLSSLIPDGVSERGVLDVGCGTGYISRPLAAWVEYVDAVDISPAMIAAGKLELGGKQSNIHWQIAPIETAVLRPAYALIVAAASLHWMDWDVALPRFSRHLVPGGVLATVEERHLPYPWDAAIFPILKKYSLNRDFAPLDVITELERRSLFRKQGSHETPPMAYRQNIGDWVETFHARNGFSRDRMRLEDATACDAALRAAVLPYCPNGFVEQTVLARISWGAPLARGPE